SHIVYFGFDTDGNLTSVEDANSHTSTATFNGIGWKTGVSDALSHSISLTLDNWGRATSVTTPAGTTTSVFDANSNVTSTTDANSHTSTATFDYENRPLVLTKANGDAITYAYDASGQKGLLSSKTDGNSYVTSYSYTSRNQPYITTYPDSTTESWTYNNDGSVATHVDGNSHTISYGYDHRGLLTSVSYPAGTGISYTYDVAGQKTAMTDATGSTSYTPDGTGRITSVTSPNGTVGYAFDTANRQTSMSVTGTGTWYYSYDAGDRLTQVTNPSSENSYFSYDAANRQTGQTNGNSSTVATTFDSANRPTEILHKDSSNNVLADYQYSYDGVGNVSTRTDTDGTVTSFGYDNADQLTSESRSNSHSTGYDLAYTYDHNANRLTKVVGTGGGAVTTTNTYGTHDQLLTSGSKSYGYDYNGNCTSVTVGSSVTSISYDYENRVTGITYPSSATNSFTYNGNDMRMQKVDSTGTANYLCDGTTPASSVLKDGSAVYTPGLSERRGSTSKFYHGDALGSTRGITNSSQTVTDTVLYDAFGVTVSRTGTTPTPFGFVGNGQYQTDSDSGLMLLGHRYYDASVGRFISSDPAKSGNNWYAYCNNNPLNGTDPSGYEVSKTGLAVGIVVGISIIASGGTIGVAIAVGALVGAVTAYLETTHDHPDPSDGANPYKDALDTGLVTAVSLCPVELDPPPIQPVRTPGFGDLTPDEIEALQQIANDHNAPIIISGSAGRGARRGIGTDLPIGKGPGTRSDLDIAIPGPMRDGPMGDAIKRQFGNDMGHPPLKYLPPKMPNQIEFTPKPK
ncbi:MAG: repeat-containing protein, partial [Chthonomonadales bacterium]|nr:repeat-containing protein [Chthonomonadales bacterium]